MLAELEEPRKRVREGPADRIGGPGFVSRVARCGHLTTIDRVFWPLLVGPTIPSPKNGLPEMAAWNLGLSHEALEPALAIRTDNL
jgi:hypothetical protein